MGTGLAETIGVTKSSIFKKYLCIIGDGSFLMNVQDLQTISQDKKNVVIILVNNNGYLAISIQKKNSLEAGIMGHIQNIIYLFQILKKLQKLSQ